MRILLILSISVFLLCLAIFADGSKNSDHNRVVSMRQLKKALLWKEKMHSSTQGKRKHNLLARKHLRQLLHQKRKKALRRKKQLMMKNVVPMAETPTTKKKRPNIILMMTDDQDTELGSLQFMPKLNRYLREEGAEFTNGFVTTPMCCPSRSSILTGLYAHNHHVLTNNDNCSSTEWVQYHEPRTFGKYLHDAGYTTGYFGKYLNKYNGNHIPEGWDEWSGLVRNSRFYNYTLNVNGNKVRHGWDYAQDYLPDLITNDSLAFFRQTKQRQPNRPIMMVMSFPGPHGPEDSAPQYSQLFFNVTTHHTPAYDYAPNPDKQWILQVTERMEPIHKKFTDLLMTKRLQTLQSIDDAVERVFHELESLGELDNTYIFYTSDHGYHLGQFGLVKGKAFPFDVDTKVPFIVRGPKIRGGSVYHQPVANIDLAPTFLDIGGIVVPEHMDGKSIVPLFHESDDVTVDPAPSWRQAFLIERGKMTELRFAKIRHSISISGNTTVFAPPDALTNDSIPLTRQEILSVECLKPKFQAPCQLFQKRKCVKRKSGQGWKMVSCQSNLKALLMEEEALDQDLCDCEEKRLQRQFLDKHTNRKLRHAKFIAQDLRFKRSAQAETDLKVETVLKEIAQEEIDEVDIIMEDITEEIHDLQESISSNKTSIDGSNGPLVPCTVENRSVNCNQSVYTDKQAWKSSKVYINEQIRRLRSQLHELKEIRSHLRFKRPKSNEEATEDSHNDFLDMNQHQLCSCKTKRKGMLRNLRRSQRQKLRMGRLRQRLLRKMQKAEKQEMLHRSKKKMEDRQCRKSDERMNCFSHNNEHWKTAPFWSDGNFCACTNSNTNTYSCVRNVNGTHNYLYCEFVSGLITYYNLGVDPYQLRNIYLTLTPTELNFMHHQLAVLKNQGLQFSQDYGTEELKQRVFIEKYGQFLPPIEAYEENSFSHFLS